MRRDGPAGNACKLLEVKYLPSSRLSKKDRDEHNIPDDCVVKVTMREGINGEPYLEYTAIRSAFDDMRKAFVGAAAIDLSAFDL